MHKSCKQVWTSSMDRSLALASSKPGMKHTAPLLLTTWRLMWSHGTSFGVIWMTSYRIGKLLLNFPRSRIGLTNCRVAARSSNDQAEDCQVPLIARIILSTCSLVVG